MFKQELEKRYEKEVRKLANSQKLVAELQSASQGSAKDLAEIKISLIAQEQEVRNFKLCIFCLKIQLYTKQCAKLRESAATGAMALQQVPQLQNEVKNLFTQNKILTENYNSERNLRKKYYNMVEDMKGWMSKVVVKTKRYLSSLYFSGKIRVYCRVRPLSSTENQNKNKCVVFSPDEYTVKVGQSKGDTKEFQFDQIFTDENSQEDVFENTYR